jgi:hypothetical protein
MSTEPWEFFFEHAGYSYDPDRESRIDGRERCARALATAEAWASAEGYVFEWRVDSIDSSEYAAELPAYDLWYCLLRAPGTNGVLASLGGIDFGRDGDPYQRNQHYKRVVEAELADEVRAEYFKDRSLPV